MDPDKPINYPLWYTSPMQHSRDAHVSALQKFLSVIPHLIPKDSGLVSARLWHPAYHRGNIYVDGQGKITSLVNWQAASFSPVFLGTDVPLDDAKRDESDLVLNLPEDFEQLDDTTQKQLKDKNSEDLFSYQYRLLTTERNPLMCKFVEYPQIKTIGQLCYFAGNTSENWLLMMLNRLIRVQRYVWPFHLLISDPAKSTPLIANGHRLWDASDAPKPCPYRFSPEEIDKLQNECGVAFNENAEFWDSMQGVLRRDGLLVTRNPLPLRWKFMLWMNIYFGVVPGTKA
jgi:hypothetical protein